jgi:protein-ribulosamine 3-kinase
MVNFDIIVNHIQQVTGKTFNNISQSSVSGGGINAAYHLKNDTQSYFVKLNTPERELMFEAEAKGLSEMAGTQCIRIPEVICFGQTKQNSYLVLEYIPCNPFNTNSSRLLGQQLAQLHQLEQPFFGWHCDNTIGSTPQYNPRQHDWLIFWLQHRLKQQLSFAKQNGYAQQLQDKGDKLSEQLASFFDGYQVKPALLHGDLWGGNAAADPNGNPIVYDPACYYGDRETDIAMTELFGGFSPDFYAAYNAIYPLNDGYKTRKTLYNLYHILNHVNLFGGSYLSQASNMLDQLNAELA